MSLVLNRETFNAVVTLRDAILGGNEAEFRYGDMTDNAASRALCLYAASQHNYLTIVGDLTVAMLLVNHDAFANEADQIAAEAAIREWCHETTDSLLDFEFSELEAIEVTD